MIAIVLDAESQSGVPGHDQLSIFRERSLGLIANGCSPKAKIPKKLLPKFRDGKSGLFKKS